MCWPLSSNSTTTFKIVFVSVHLSLYFSDDDGGGGFLYQAIPLKFSSSLYLYLSFYLSLYVSDDGGGGSLYQAIPLQPFCHQLIKLRTVEAQFLFLYNV